MYKVYLSVSKNTIKENNITIESYIEYDIIQKIKNKLISKNKYIVYVSKPSMSHEETITDSNNIAPNINVIINTNCKENEGINVYAKAGCSISNGYAKEIYKKILPVYYNKNTDNGIMYDNENINKLSNPAVLIELGNKESIQDINWLNDNKNEIAEKITEGIALGSKLRPC